MNLLCNNENSKGIYTALTAVNIYSSPRLYHKHTNVKEFDEFQ